MSTERVIVEGLAAMAESHVMMGAPPDQVRGILLLAMERLGVYDPAFLRAAAEVIRRGPQPIDETPEEIEQARPVREMLGVRSAEDDLSAMLTAREVLESLADLLERGAAES